MKNAPITRLTTVFLQAVIILIGIGALVFLLWEPHVEGVSARATSLWEIYFDDPFLAYVYLGSIPFFVALYEAFKVLGWVGKNTAVSRDVRRALRSIRYCAAALLAFIAGAEIWIVITQSGKDDIAGGVTMGVFAACISVVIGAAAAVCERMVPAHGVLSRP